MQPTIGALVHYVSYGTPGGEYKQECRAAIITAIPPHLLTEPMDGCPNGTNGEWLASLAVLNPTGMYFNENLPLDQEEKSGGSWHWPETA